MHTNMLKYTLLLFAEFLENVSSIYGHTQCGGFREAESRPLCLNHRVQKNPGARLDHTAPWLAHQDFGLRVKVYCVGGPNHEWTTWNYLVFTKTYKLTCGLTTSFFATSILLLFYLNHITRPLHPKKFNVTWIIVSATTSHLCNIVNLHSAKLEETSLCCKYD